MSLPDHMLHPPDLYDPEDCPLCGAMEGATEENPWREGEYICPDCLALHDRAAQALADGAFVHCRGVDGRIQPRCWIQSHDAEYARVSYCDRPELPDTWIELRNIAAIEEI